MTFPIRDETASRVDNEAATRPRAPGGDRAARLFVNLVWLAMLLWSLEFIRRFAPRFPVWDEAVQWSLMPPYGRFSWAEISQPHNAHWIPLPRLLHYLFARGTGSVLPAMFFQALLLAGGARALVEAARRTRGRTDWTDAFFPLAWMHVGNCANLLSGFQLALTLPTVIATWVLVACALSPRRPGPGRSVAIAIGLILLPFCGPAGFLQALPLAASAAWSGWTGRSSTDAAERRGARRLLAGALLCALASVPSLVRLPAIAEQHSGASVPTIFGMGAALTSLAVGPAAVRLWPWSAVFVLLVLLVTVWSGVRSIRRTDESTQRTFAIAAAVVGNLGVVFAVGFGRNFLGWQNGFALRYVTLSLPLLCCAYLWWSACRDRIGRGVVCASLAIASIVALPFNATIGAGYGASVRVPAASLEEMILRGEPADELVRFFAAHFQNQSGRPDLERSREVLRSLCAARRPPFDRGVARDPGEFE